MTSANTSTRAATAIGAGAILLWSSLALLTAASGTMPPFQLAAVTFLVGGLIGAATWPFRPAAVRALRQDWRVWALGIGGLFGYHALYFAALRSAPPAEAGLINYLWPLLIVIFASTLPAERLRPAHVFGATLGFAGVLVLFAGRDSLELSAEHAWGYGFALVAAFFWAGYSVLSRRFGDVPSDVVAGFCLGTAALAALCHLAFEQTVWPQSAGQWAAVLALGLGPVGAAFYLWDVGVKRGDIKLLGVLSYAAPVLSTLILVAAGYAPVRWTLGAACALIVAGAAVAASASRDADTTSR